MKRHLKQLSYILRALLLIAAFFPCLAKKIPPVLSMKGRNNTLMWVIPPFEAYGFLMNVFCIVSLLLERMSFSILFSHIVF